MKKLIIIFVLSLISLLCYSQVEVSVGYTYFNPDMSKTTTSGINVGILSHRIYADLSGNMAMGNGIQMEYSSSGLYKSNKSDILICNIGYNVMGVRERFEIIPVVGISMISDIYQNTLLYNYYYGEIKYSFNFGVVTRYLLTRRLGAMLGAGYKDIFKIGLFYKI